MSVDPESFAPDAVASEPVPPRRVRPGTVGALLAAVAVLTVAMNLRLGAAAPGPLIDRITAAFGLGETAGGVVNALPGLCFGVLGLLAVPIARRLGLTGAIVLAFAVTTLGLLLRPLAGSFPLFVVLSALALIGPATGNVLVPAWVKRHGGRRAVQLMTVYTVMLATGGGAGSLLSVPMAGSAPDGWRRSLFVWGILAAVPVVVWLVVWRRTGHDFPPLSPAGHLRGSLLRSTTAIALTVTFGLQSMTAYVQMGWLPRILTDAGLAPTAAGALTALISGFGIIGGLLMPLAVARVRNLGPVLLALGLLTAAGYVGLLLAPAAAPLLWTVLLGIGGWTFATAIALIPSRSHDPLVTARLSGMVQPVGYFLAALGPFAVGLFHEILGGWSVILVVLAAAGLAMGLVGWRAAGPHLVDDELRA